TPHGLFAGLATLDLVHTLERPLGPDEKSVALRQDIAAGGPAANAAVTFAALGGDAVLGTAPGAHPPARPAAPGPPPPASRRRGAPGGRCACAAPPATPGLRGPGRRFVW